MNVDQLSHQLQAVLHASLEQTAENDLLSRSEQNRLESAFVYDLAEQYRFDLGPGSRVYVPALKDMITDAIQDFALSIDDETDVDAFINLLSRSTSDLGALAEDVMLRLDPPVVDEADHIDVVTFEEALLEALDTWIRSISGNNLISKSEQSLLTMDFIQMRAQVQRAVNGGRAVRVDELMRRISQDLEAGYNLWSLRNGLLDERTTSNYIQMLKDNHPDVAVFAKDILDGLISASAPTAPVDTGLEVGIISDIDKTIMPPTGPTYPGMSTLLNVLEFGDGGGRAGDIAFVTARGADRIADIPAYFSDHGIPDGPIETGVGTLPWVAQPEKVKDASIYFDANPAQRFVLFGDTSHRDPEVYQDLIAKYGSRVIAAFAHQVTRTVSPDRVVGLHLIQNYAQAASILLDLDVITKNQAERVMLDAQAEGLVISDSEIMDLLNP